MLLQEGDSSDSGLRLFTLQTVQYGAQMLVSTGLSQHPRPVGHRWLMTQMLSVSAGEVRNPIPDFILVVSDDLLVHHDLGGTVHRL